MRLGFRLRDIPIGLFLTKKKKKKKRKRLTCVWKTKTYSCVFAMADERVQQ